MLTEDQVKAACISAIAKGQSLSAVMAWAFGLDRAWGSVEVKRVWLACKAKPDMRGNACQCSDSGCKGHPGTNHCEKGARTCLRRSDMDDETGTLFCIVCASDAMDSGLFFEDRGAYIRATTKRGGK